ncbi:RNA 3'-terminal phosphate cyclase-like protein [Nematocida sp. LUAm3]|nr:RNA 3'-terminal phosphate cyclase-like protein [Nematocida sp. LUAm3]KAI5176109.1 RNA 3'-terminal phosphate cyclase-like protein [Nematocida sp. LUAm2]KAI5178997.1 RNA 3'-terminal phosphate cyclase-like protein [Nematocida sp. LUAm1]
MKIITELPRAAISMALISKKKIEIPCAVPAKRKEIEEFLNFISKLSSSTYAVHDTNFSFSPGVLKGGAIEFLCASLTIPELLTDILPVLFLSRSPLHLTLHGTTNSPPRAHTDAHTDARGTISKTDARGTISKTDMDMDTYTCSIDTIKSVHCKILNMFGVSCEIKIVKRAIYPSTEGEVLLLCSVAEELSPVCIDRREQLDRIVSVNYSSRLSGDILNRITNYHRDTLKPITPSIKVYNDIGNKSNSKGTGYGALLLGLGSNSVYYSEYMVGEGDSLIDSPPERRSEESIKEFLRAIRRSGAVDYKVQNFLFLLLPLTSVDASSVLIRKVSSSGKEILSLLEEIVQYKYTIEAYRRTEEDMNNGLSKDLFLIKSFGVGYKNIYRAGQ